jgi:tetratricopeptide (TPR) repeat protein
MTCCKSNMGLWIAGFVALGTVTGMLRSQEKPAAQEKPAIQENANDVRFDLKVREDFFAGFEGNKEALERAMKTCETVLAKEPKHAEAMVWLGSGQVFLSGQFFNKGNVAEGMKSWQAGLSNMDKAAELEPDNIGVLIPRAAVLIPASRGLPEVIRKPVLESVLKNFEHVYEQQKGELDKIGEHPLGELRMGLAEIYRRLGRADDSKLQLEAVLKELPNTDYATEATTWLAAKPNDKLAHNCIGCHSK